jgi:segregation and condensation protein B
MKLSSQIEALLFWKNENVTIAWLSKSLEKSREEIEEALKELDSVLKTTERGVFLQRNGEEIALKTAPEASSLIEKFSKEELVKELTPSSLETLSIISYRGPISKKEIDYIRGVNSGFILRNLLIRGLIAKEEGKEGRGILYKPTLELLSLLGISNMTELEEYETVKNEIEQFKTQQNVEN